MLLCRCEESLLFRNAREVYVYQRRRTRMGSPPLIFQDSFDAAAAIFFFSLAVSLRESRAKTTGTKRKTTPEGWFL